MKTRSIIFSIVQIAVIAAVLAGGWFYYQHLMNTAPKNKKRQRPERVVKVQIKELELSEEHLFINTNGTVLPERQLSLKPRVTGEIISIHPELHSGGMIYKDEVIAQIDPADYEIALIRAENKLNQAKFAYSLELGEQDVAKYEWNLLENKESITNLEKQLILRIPHLEKAKSDIKAAEAELHQAKLNLQRCKIRAPYDLMILSRMITEGSQVNTQSIIADLVAADTFWVEASIPYQDLAWLSKNNASATIIPASDRSGSKWQGRFIRRKPAISTDARRARIIIEVKNPLTQNSAPLLLNSFVKVRISGPIIKNIFKIPITAFHDGQKIYLINEESRLEIRDIKPLWSEGNYIYVSEGLKENEKIILNPISTPIPGIKVLATDQISKVNIKKADK